MVAMDVLPRKLNLAPYIRPRERAMRSCCSFMSCFIRSLLNLVRSIVRICDTMARSTIIPSTLSISSAI